jgi:lipopolysaccharide biosynthesis protein
MRLVGAIHLLRFRGKQNFVDLADHARDTGQWALASRLYRKILDRDSRNAAIWIQYGHALKESGELRDPEKLAQAELAYRKALSLEPDVADSHLQLGHVLKLQCKTEEAGGAYLRAVVLDTSLDTASHELAQLGWSEAQLSELQSMFGSGSTDPSATASVSSRKNPSGRRQDGLADHASSDNLSSFLAKSSHNGGARSTCLGSDLSEDIQLISQSGLFDVRWYLDDNRDVCDQADDPILHYLHRGALEGRDPHPFFDSDWYLANNPDVAAEGVNPLVHYLRWGASERRAPNPLLHYVLSAPSPTHLLTPRQEICIPDLFALRGIRPRGDIAVVLHLFDPDLWDEMREAIERISQPFDLFVSLVKGSSEHVRLSIIESFPHAYVFDFEDHGRDIGTFLVFLQSGVLFKYDLICKLHTKRSPHRADGDAWRRALIAGVLGSSGLVDQIVSNFRSDPDLGMVVADGNIFRGHSEWASNEKLLGQLLPRIGISPEVKDRSFPGGSIFWIRSFLLRTLAGMNISIDDFDPEPLKVDGSLGHAVERIFGLICEDAGMRVVETSQLLEAVQPPTQESSQVHLIAFYLPQFHPIPENDKWWGAGFTEWTNVTRAEPLYKGHRQPRLPSELGFYDLRLPEVREAQAELARRYGLSAFCYYYYWFNGRQILERPLDEVLASGKPDFPFLICWANEPWTRNWDGFNRDILLPQTYEPGWPKRLAADIAPLLRDRRYFRLNGEPMLLIYRIGHIPTAKDAIRDLRAALSGAGVPRVHIAAGWVWFPDDVDYPNDPSVLGLDAYFELPPHWLPAQPLDQLPSELSKKFAGELKDYNRTVSVALAELDEHVEGRRHRGVMTGWDPTARKGQRSVIFQGGTPTSFRRWLCGTVAHERGQEGERVVFINAWNEWAEGAYLEPDRDFGRGWLEALGSAACPSELNRAKSDPESSGSDPSSLFASIG